MAKRISIKGKGADLFFSGEPPSPASSIPPPVSQISSLPPQQNNGQQDMKKSSNEEMKKTLNEEMKNSGFEEMKKANKREFFKKVNYRLCPEAIESIEDIKLILQRKYKIKATYEDIAEAIIIDSYQDLLNNGETSKLVCLLLHNEELKK